jgi:hypothetical protein
LVAWADAKQLGVVWPRDRCARCEARFVTLVLVLLDDAKALVCEDAAACLARRQHGRQLELDVEAANAVDRAVSRCYAVRVAEAVGHFLRGGEPGPSRFEAPKGIAA